MIVLVASHLYQSCILYTSCNDILSCIYWQVYAVLLDIIYIAAPLLLAIATALRVFAVLSPYKYVMNW